jgi:phage internal scaffolding protein
MDIQIRKWHERERRGMKIKGESMTQQHMAAETDINNIMKKYEKTGIVTHLAKYQGDYQDFTVMPDFHTAMNTIREADEMFLTLPASVRDKFDNDPGKFVEFATDDCNHDALVDLGLAYPKQEPEQTTRKRKKTASAEVETESVSDDPAQSPS